MECTVLKPIPDQPDRLLRPCRIMTVIVFFLASGYIFVGGIVLVNNVWLLIKPAIDQSDYAAQ